MAKERDGTRSEKLGTGRILATDETLIKHGWVRGAERVVELIWGRARIANGAWSADGRQSRRWRVQGQELGDDMRRRTSILMTRKIEASNRILDSF